MPIAAEIYYQAHQDEANVAVILLHGAGGSHLSWPPDMRRLSGFKVLALDLPGHGKSTGRGQQSIEAYAGSVKEWMQTIGIHRAIFVGHSMGAGIALKIALDTPEQVLGLGLIGSAARLAVNPKLLAASGSAEHFDQAIQNIVAWSFSQNADHRLTELVTQRMAEIRPAVLYGDLLACDRFDVSERVAEIRCPVLVVCGSEDKMTPIRNSQFIADHIPGARLEIVSGAGHMVMLEEPQFLSDILVRFLERLEY